MANEGAPHRYPVGVQVFQKVREEGLLYVDKTRYVWDLTHSGGDYLFLSRPRRFGKTLLVSTLEAYFKGRRELFDGLEISRLETDWAAHPVIRLDLSVVKTSSERTLRQQLSTMMGAHEREWGIEPVSESISDRLAAVVHEAVERTGQRALVLVDEYDAPMLNVLHDPERLQAFREVMRELYAPLKSLEPSLRFVFLTGITKYSQLSIFSELNNIKNVSMLPDYAGICGITEEELHGQMGRDVLWLAERLGISGEDAYARLKEKYDGYHFCEDSPDVYNPFSLLMSLDTRQIGSWWYESGTPTSLVNILASSGIEVSDLEGGVTARAESFDAPTERSAEPVAFMYQAGYLTIKGFDPRRDTYTLGIPNAEVADGLYGSLLPVMAGVTGAQRDGFSYRFADFIEAGDLDGALTQLRSFLKGVPYDLAPKDEKSFQALLFVIFKVTGTMVDSEVRTSAGRVDLVVQTASDVFVMELKYNRSAQEAMEQVESRQYALPWAHDGRRVVKAGVNFSPDKRTIEKGWIIRVT